MDSGVKSVNCRVNSEQFTACNVHCKLESEQFTVYNVDWDNLWERRGGSMMNGVPWEVPGQTKGQKPSGHAAPRVFRLWSGLGSNRLFTRLESSLVPEGFLTAQFLQKL